MDVHDAFMWLILPLSRCHSETYLSGVRRGLFKMLIPGKVSFDKVKGAEEFRRCLRAFLLDPYTVNEPKT